MSNGCGALLAAVSGLTGIAVTVVVAAAAVPAFLALRTVQ